MKRITLLKVLVIGSILFLTSLLHLTHAQTAVGIDVISPQEKLDVDGAIHIGTDFNNLTTAPQGGAGTIRWNGINFEGWDGSAWITFGAGSYTVDTLPILQDADTDTKIQVEESPDDDFIRFDLAGTEYFRMKSGHLGVHNTGSSVFIGNNAGANDDFSNNVGVAIGSDALQSNTTGTGNS